MNQMARYIIGFLLAVGLIVVVIVLIVHGLASGPQSSTTTHTINLNDYVNSTTDVRLTIDSPITAATTHKDIVITVGNDESTLQVTQGYDGQIVRQQSYPMDVVSYAVFLRALTTSGFTQGNNDSRLQDERGQCPLGTRYIYEIVDNTGNSLQHYWHTSCGTGTLNGSYSTINQLFERQISDYGTLTSDVSFY